ncbi:hypothetical protein pb186bvf_019023 [Paramecium bursaria]
MIGQEAENNDQIVEYKGIILIIIKFDKEEVEIEVQRSQTFESVLIQQNFPLNFKKEFPKDPKLSLCESGQNELDKTKQLGYYGMDHGWIIYVT